jgi:hypothetical protein
MAHHCGFTQKVLTETLKFAGFKGVVSEKRGAPFFDLWALACKENLNEEVLNALADTHFSPI